MIFYQGKIVAFFKGIVIFFMVPLVVLALAGFFLIQPFQAYLKELINFIILVAISFSFVSIFSNTLLKKGLLIFSVLLLHVLLFVKLSFYYIYGSKINGSAFYLIFETNKKESIGFLSTYLSGFVLLLAGIILVSLFFFFQYIAKKKISKSDFLHFNREVVKIFFFSGIIFASIYVINWKLKQHNIPIAIVISYEQYMDTKALIEKDLSKPLSDYLEVESAPVDPQIHVVIIGETIAKGHMSLYNYNRETNPILENQKNELYIFRDIISPNCDTMASLDRVLTFSDFEGAYKENNSSIIQIANEAEYETYWISNQQAIGEYDAIATQIGYASKHKYFLAKDDFRAISYDEVLLDKLDEVLLDKNDKKVIFVHIMGAHLPYDIRYPDSHNYFEDLIDDDELSKSQKRKINYYDNAIRYNDFIVSSIFNKVKQMDVKSSVIFFSDHGEDVFDSNKNQFLSHNEYRYTSYMYEVPFVLWLSKDFKTTEMDNNLNNFLERKYILEDFPHTFSELIGVKHNLFEPHKSILNNGFKEKARLVGDGKDYDAFKLLYTN